jgi:myo-inositol-1(or 4)-monophosphatase
MSSEPHPPAPDHISPGPDLGVAALGRLESLATELAVEAGRLVTQERPSAVSSAATKSSDTDIVTVMDTRSEALLRGRLSVRRPEDAILGEEGDDRPGTSGLTWVLDPIDGTVNYLYDLPMYAVSVAVATGDPRSGAWAPVAGAVCVPRLGVVWHARKGGGAWRRELAQARDIPVRVSAQSDLHHALLGTGFGYLPQTRAAQGVTVAALLPLVRDIRRIGSAAYDLCLVAQGSLDVYYESGLHPWDLAAGWLLVCEAGGVVADGGSGPPDGMLTVAGNRVLVSRLQELLAH